MKPSSQNLKHGFTRNVLLFLIPSLFGVFAFMVPVPFEDGYTIPIAIMKDWLISVIGGSMPEVILGLMLLSAILTLIVSFFGKGLKGRYPFFYHIFSPLTFTW